MVDPTEVLTPPTLTSRLANLICFGGWIAVEWCAFGHFWKAAPGGRREWLQEWLSWITLHAFLSTVATPLARVELGKWVGTISPMYFFNRGAPLFNDTLPSPLRGEVTVVDMYPTTRGMDLFFGCHALFGLLWVAVAYAQMVVLQRSRARHAAFSKVAFGSFACHIAAALAILAFDAPRNSVHNKLKLLEVTVTSSGCFFVAVRHAFARRQHEHRRWMVACFLLSIEGAGTIRSITLLSETANSLVSYRLRRRLGYASSACAHTSQQQFTWGEHCATAYLVRLLLVRLMSAFHYWCFWRWERQEASGKAL